MTTLPSRSDELPRPGRRHPGSIERYIVAIGVVAAAAALKFAHPQLGQERPFLLLTGAVILAAWHGGRGPALVAMALAVVAAAYCFLQSYGSLSLTKTGRPLRLSHVIEKQSVTREPPVNPSQ